MSCRDLTVTVVLDVHAVTCEGVWLCQNGGVTLSLRAFGSTARTSKNPPRFPVIYNQIFIFQKMFRYVFCVDDLRKRLSEEIFYAELVQWPEVSLGIVLAKFEASIEEMVLPNTCDSELHLLMEREPAFPGIISPKLEVSAKVTLDDNLCDHVRKTGYLSLRRTNLQGNKHSCDSNTSVIPRQISSANHRKITPLHLKRVCHSQHTSINYLGKQVPVSQTRFPDESKSSKFAERLTSCKWCNATTADKATSDTCVKMEEEDYSSGHVSACCDVCNKYRNYFRKNDGDLPKAESKHYQQLNGAGSSSEDVAVSPLRCTSPLGNRLELMKDVSDEEKPYQDAFSVALQKFYEKLYERAKLKS